MRTYSTLGLLLLFDLRVNLIWEVRSLVVEVVALKRDITVGLYIFALPLQAGFCSVAIVVLDSALVSAEYLGC